LHFVIALMFDSGKTAKLRWSVEELLQRAKVALPAHHPERFRETFEAAFDLLKHDRLIADWDYEEWLDLPEYKWMPI
jgi:hypothetical protein